MSWSQHFPICLRYHDDFAPWNETKKGATPKLPNRGGSGLEVSDLFGGLIWTHKKMWANPPWCFVFLPLFLPNKRTSYCIWLLAKPNKLLPNKCLIKVVQKYVCFFQHPLQIFVWMLKRKINHAFLGGWFIWFEGCGIIFGWFAEMVKLHGLFWICVACNNYICWASELCYTS